MGETAILTGRQAVLVEQDEEFFIKGSERIKNVNKKNSDELFE